MRSGVLPGDRASGHFSFEPALLSPQHTNAESEKTVRSGRSRSAATLQTDSQIMLCARQFCSVRLVTGKSGCDSQCIVFHADILCTAPERARAVQSLLSHVHISLWTGHLTSTTSGRETKLRLWGSQRAWVFPAGDKLAQVTARSAERRVSAYLA